MRPRWRRLKKAHGCPTRHPHRETSWRVLSFLLIHDYEERVFPIDKPDPVAAIRFRMMQQGLTHKDLVPFLRSRSRGFEVLSRTPNF